MNSGRKFIGLAGLALLAMVASACSETISSRQVRRVINGVDCDPSRATLVAQRSNQSEIDRFDDLERVRLYRIPDGHLFVEEEHGYDIQVHLVSLDDAPEAAPAVKFPPANLASVR